MMLLAPSAKALQSRLNVCSAYAKKDDIIFNPVNTICMVFRLRSFVHPNATKFSLGDTPLILAKDVLHLHMRQSRADADIARRWDTLI